MTETPKPSIYESTFVKSDVTDAILVVNENKLHVNKTLLSCHSDYFKALFNSEFEDKSMEEIPIKGVNFEDFVTVLSLVHWNRIEPKRSRVEELLVLADRFLLTNAKRYLELFIISTDMAATKKLCLADKFQLDTLMDHSLQMSDKNSYLPKETLQKLSDKTKRSAMSTNTIYEETFAKNDKTDAVLVVDGQKLHVNKAFLSYHSDYFNILFNSEFKEKSMKEIPIEDVDFTDFAILLSLVHPNPLKPTEQKAERLLELADRFLLPAARRHLELFLLSSEKTRFEKLRIADKFKLDDLFDQGLKMYTDQKDFYFMKVTPAFESFADGNKVKILDRLFVVLKFPTTILQPARDLGLPLLPIPAMAMMPASSDESSNGWSDEGEEHFSDESFTE